MMRSSFFIFLLAVLTLASCHRDTESEEQSTASTTFVPTVVEEVAASVLGYVYGLDGEPIADATVSIYSGTTTTNSEGVFEFTSQNMDGSGTYVKVTKDGYILGSDYIYPVNAATTFSYVQMMPLTETGSISASQGGTVAVAGGGSVTFRPNSLVDASGAPYSGILSVTAYRIGSDDPNLNDLMPGGLYAVDETGSNVVLGTYGMVAVELRDAAGNELNLADGTTAEVTFPIADAQQGDAPAEIELWSFDEVQGIWVEEGSAVRDGNIYVAQVSHFSFWNCDAPFPLVQMCGTVVFEDGTPVTGAQITITTASTGVGFGWTDLNGAYCGKMPKGQELTIAVYIPGCPDPVAVVTRGPYFSGGDIEPIVVATSAATLEGVVVCDGVPQADAQVIIRRGNATFVRTTDADGNFEFSVAQDPCGQGADFSVFALLDSGQASETEIISGSSTTIVLDACTDCPISVTVGNQPDLCEEAVGILTASVTGGSGNYEYMWPNGGPVDSASFYEVPGLYCVTVTDVVEACSVVQCIEIVADSTQGNTIVIGVTVDNPQGCNGSTGGATLQVTGGTAPYMITWSQDANPIAAFENEMVITGLSEGVYAVEVTDANGCSRLTRFEIFQASGLQIDASVDDDCQTATIEVEVFGGTPPYTFLFSNSATTITNMDGILSVDKSTLGNDPFFIIDVTDANGCTGLSEVYIDPTIVSADVQYGDCLENGFFRFIELDSFATYQIVNEVDEVLFDSWGQFWAVDVLPNNFDLLVTATVSSPNGNSCTDTQTLELPKFFGLTIDSATNGTITATLDATAQCRDCQAATTFTIYSTDYVDVTGSNGNLSPGTYFVVVRDSQTECIIAIEEVTLN
jgi:hypothetical protein